jgi:hypothetical protein
VDLFGLHCELLSFLNIYLVYHQISLTIDDEEKTAFIIQDLLGKRFFCIKNFVVLGLMIIAIAAEYGSVNVSH